MVEEHCVLEAPKDGVHFRKLSESLNVDHVTVLRSALSSEAVKHAIERVITHEGKPYNFDFDFFNADRLVRTELIYRAFDGLEGLEFPLTERSGRQTLSAEDILHYAYCSQRFSTLAHTTVLHPGAPRRPVGSDHHKALNYRQKLAQRPLSYTLNRRI